MPKKLTTEDFKTKAIVKHGNNYNYKNSIYTKSCEKIEIICGKHGSFWQIASSHLMGMGCPKCAGHKKTTTEFVKELQLLFKNLDFSKVKYSKAHTKVEVICPLHGSFLIKPNDLLQGHGCKYCSRINLSKKMTRTLHEFIELANRYHNFKYNYINSKYVNTMTPIEIICSKHGSFWQKPNDHLAGTGCPKCNGYHKTTEEIVIDFQKVHQLEYDYKKVQYKKAVAKVEIICHKHGSFWQQPAAHLNGSGCPKCSRYGFKPDEPAILYYIKDIKFDLYKIGITNRTIKERFVGYKDRIKILSTEYFVKGKYAKIKEMKLHNQFQSFKAINNDFKNNGSTEFFSKDVLNSDGLLITL